MGRIKRTQLQRNNEPKIMDDPQSPDRPAYPRRFPRIGGQFQTRISKARDQLERPLPELMSSEFPHVSEEEFQGNKDSNKVIDHSILEDSKKTFNCLNLEQAAPRGGLLLHKPSTKDKDRFQLFVQPLIQYVEDVPIANLANDAWKQHMIQIHNKESPQKRRRAPRGGVKRKCGNNDEDELIWSLENVSKKKKRKEAHSSLIVGEDGARALEYLQLEHDGNVITAELNALVDLTAGKASKVQKSAKIRLHKRKLPPSSSSESWRTVYEETGFDSILGVWQDESFSPYVINQATSIADQDPVAVDLSYYRDNLRGAWRSILACGKSIERQLDECTSRSKKVLLSTLVSFISNAYRLPVPESCFGSHHVIIEEVSNCLLTILEHVANAREIQAKIKDRLYDESGDGVDFDSLRKYIEVQSKSLPLQLDEVNHLNELKDIIAEWETRLASIFEPKEEWDWTSEGRDDLLVAERMELETRSHGFVTKALVQLRSRIRKAKNLRGRIIHWKHSCREGTKGTFRNTTALVKDAKRLKLIFPEVRDVLRFHNTVELWVDRANIAIRSKISLTEVKSLINQGKKLPLDLSEYIEKLKSRVVAADEWLQCMYQIVPCPTFKSGDPDLLKWIREIRVALYEGKQGALHELASEGSRIPVEVDAVKLLQVELDAKTWSQRARKWIPTSKDNRKGKLVDVREHVKKASTLRERLALPDLQKKEWILEGEIELTSIVHAADSWFEKYKPFLEGDNRKNQRRSCLSLPRLRQIVEEENNIHVNMGKAAAKISRILTQAEVWYAAHTSLLNRFKSISLSNRSPRSNVELSEIEKAAESAASDISLDLDEAIELKELLERIQTWFDRVSIVAPKRSKRHNKAGRSNFTMNDLIGLIEESSSFPVDVESELKRLQTQLNSIQAWRLHAAHELQGIALGFVKLRESLDVAYGIPKEFCIDRLSKLTMEGAVANNANDRDEELEIDSVHQMPLNNLENSEDVPQPRTASSDEDISLHPTAETGYHNVHRMIRELKNGAKENAVTTEEAEVAELMDSVSRWCLRSLKYLNSPREIFDKRFFGAFDRFVSEGNELLRKHEMQKTSFAGTSNKSLSSCWSAVVSDQLERLEILRSEREKFIRWCELANQVLLDEKKVTAEKLKELAEKSRCFPAVSDMVHKVRGLSVKVEVWVEETRQVYRSGRKLTMQDAKSLLEAGEKLKVNTQELRTLRASLRVVRSWTNKVKKCNLEHGEIHVSTVNDLIREHESFLIEMPEELLKLEEATQGYCICRRPYEGFMIGCDECDEWYHGSCIGVSESRADRFDKYVCVRCSVKNIFKSCAVGALDIVRKWTSRKDLKKARQVEYQKHQRKVRKETKDMEKFQALIEKLEEKFSTEASSHSQKDENIEKMVEAVATFEVANHGLISTVPTADDRGVERLHSETSIQNSTVLSKKSESTDGITMAMANEAPKSGSGNTISATNNSLGNESLCHIEKRKDTAAEIDKTKVAVQKAKERLQELSKECFERKEIEKLESDNAAKLRRWCVRVRFLVLVPSRQEQSEEARPPLDGGLSVPMLSVLSDAKSLGIESLPDVFAMTNFLKCMSWSLFTLSIINRKPAFGEMKVILKIASRLNFPNEKALKTIRVMNQRAVQWQGKIKKALAPKPGELKPISVPMLRELLAGAEAIALKIPELNRVKIAIKDKGVRHCLCGGPSNGGFMLSCCKCKKKFHESCVTMNKDSESKLSKQNWVCPGCSEQKPSKSFIIHDDEDRIEDFVFESKKYREASHISPHAPDPQKLWPPFALFGSLEASEVLGAECSLISDDVATIEISRQEGKPKNCIPGLPIEACSNGNIPPTPEKMDHLPIISSTSAMLSCSTVLKEIRPVVGPHLSINQQENKDHIDTALKTNNKHTAPKAAGTDASVEGKLLGQRKCATAIDERMSDVLDKYASMESKLDETVAPSTGTLSSSGKELEKASHCSLNATTFSSFEASQVDCMKPELLQSNEANLLENKLNVLGAPSVECASVSKTEESGKSSFCPSLNSKLKIVSNIAASKDDRIKPELLQSNESDSMENKVDASGGLSMEYASFSGTEESRKASFCPSLDSNVTMASPVTISKTGRIEPVLLQTNESKLMENETSG